MAPMVALNSPCWTLPSIVSCSYLCFASVLRSDILSTCACCDISVPKHLWVNRHRLPISDMGKLVRLSRPTVRVSKRKSVSKHLVGGSRIQSQTDHLSFA